MNLLDFHKRFPDEQSCRQHLKSIREQQGITCKDCGCIKHYWIESVSKWRCAACRTCTNLKAGTMMEQSKLSLLQWFTAMHLMTSVKKPFSALEMKRQLGAKRYAPIWNMMLKIRIAMGNRDDLYQLKGQIEVDDGAFIISNVEPRDSLGKRPRKEFKDPNRKDPEKKGKRGRGSERRIDVLIMAESEFRPEQKDRNKKNRRLGYIKMKVLDGGVTTNAINYEIRKSVDPHAYILTDGYAAYNKLNTVVDNHTKLIVPPKEAPNKLPWVHMMISNAKRQLLGIHHSIHKNYLQLYLNEFCYKLNRRNCETDIFDRLLVAGIS